MSDTTLQMLAESLRAHPSIRSKRAIAESTQALALTAQSDGLPGDDAAVLPREGGFDLLAGEGFIPAFVEADPWFAGWCGLMVNISDIAAMGGRAVAVIDQIWAPDAQAGAELMRGMQDASRAYGVPIVGGHTNFAAPGLSLAVSILGRASALISSFTARPGDVLVAAIDPRGHYVNFDNFCAALDAPQDRLRGDLEILPTLAERTLVRAGKDISQGGIVGTALMLAECSSVGIEIDLDAIQPPGGVAMARWLRSFPSFGFLLSVSAENIGAVCDLFTARDIAATAIGTVTSGSAVTLRRAAEHAVFWDHAETPYLGLAPKEKADA